MTEPRLSVICPLGPQGDRRDRVLAALEAQTAGDAIEIIFIQGAPGTPPPRAASAPPARALPFPVGASLGEARAAGVRAARGEIVACMGDHVYPDPGWAEALIRAYRERPWDAIGYAFRNANPDTYGSRGAMIADFCDWLAPLATGEAARLPVHDVSYRRGALIELGDELGELLCAEPLLLEELRSRERRFGIAGEAEAAHGCLRTVRDNALASFDYCRALGAIQARREGWGLGRRLAQALLSALGAPPVRTAGALRAMSRRSAGGAALRHLPAIVAQHSVAAAGQACGYLAGDGGAAARFPKWEMGGDRGDR